MSFLRIKITKRLFGLRTLIAILRTTLSALFNTLRIEHSANNSVSDSKVLNATSANHDHRVFLKIVTFAWDVGSHFLTVGEANTGDFADSGVWFLWSLGGHLGADASFERRIVESRAVFNSIETARQSHSL